MGKVTAEEGDQRDSMQQEITELESLIPDIDSKVNNVLCTKSEVSNMQMGRGMWGSSTAHLFHIPSL